LRSLAALTATLSLPFLLSGCISLFPASKPVQLYRFGDAGPPPAATAPVGLMVSKAATVFPIAAAGDTILTFSGTEAAYIGGARWFEPASTMFDEAVVAAFDKPGAPRLTGRTDSVGAVATLKLEVRRFEASYDQGPTAAPTVVIEVRALLLRNSDRSIVGEKLFDIRQPADDNRIGAIVAAFNTAVGQTVSGIRDWTTVTASTIKP
jgi:cholesterol transport system auxiliary component